MVSRSGRKDEGNDRKRGGHKTLDIRQKSGQLAMMQRKPEGLKMNNQKASIPNPTLKGLSKSM